MKQPCVAFPDVPLIRQTLLNSSYLKYSLYLLVHDMRPNCPGDHTQRSPAQMRVWTTIDATTLTHSSQNF